MVRMAKLIALIFLGWIIFNPTAVTGSPLYLSSAATHLLDRFSPEMIPWFIKLPTGAYTRNISWWIKDENSSEWMLDTVKYDAYWANSTRQLPQLIALAPNYTFRGAALTLEERP